LAEAYTNHYLLFRDNIEPGGCKCTDHKFVMHTFTKPTTCNRCSKFLKGMIFQVSEVLACFYDFMMFRWLMKGRKLSWIMLLSC